MEAKPLRTDIIRTLPSCIIENILCLLPIQDAVLTSILSREWRYIWTKIPELVFFEEDMFYESSDDDDENQVSCLEGTSEEPRCKRKLLSKGRKFFNAIFQALSMHEGPIIKFTLEVKADGEVDDYYPEIERMIVHLLRKNTVKELNLSFLGRVPLSVFSLQQLTHLELMFCDFYFEPTFSGFGSLTSLGLDNVNISKRTLLHLLSSSPLLKSLSLYIDADNIVDSDDTSIKDLFECLRMIQDLRILSRFIQIFLDTSLMKSEIDIKLEECLDIRLEHLIELEMLGIPNLKHEMEFMKLILVKSPKLKKLTFSLKNKVTEDEGLKICNSLKNYFDIWLEHLNEFEIAYFDNLKHEMELVKLILAKSPALKKVSILLNYNVTKDEEIVMLRMLLRCPRASSTVEIIVDRLHEGEYEDDEDEDDDEDEEEDDDDDDEDEDDDL